MAFQEYSIGALRAQYFYSWCCYSKTINVAVVLGFLFQTKYVLIQSESKQLHNYFVKTYKNKNTIFVCNTSDFIIFFKYHAFVFFNAGCCVEEDIKG